LLIIIILSFLTFFYQWGEAVKIFSDISSRNAALNDISFRSAIFSYAELIQFEKVAELLNSMESHGVKLDESDMETIFRMCERSGHGHLIKTSSGRFAFSKDSRNSSDSISSTEAASGCGAIELTSYASYEK